MVHKQQVGGGLRQSIEEIQSVWFEFNQPRDLHQKTTSPQQPHFQLYSSGNLNKMESTKTYFFQLKFLTTTWENKTRKIVYHLQTQCSSKGSLKYAVANLL